MSLQSLLTQTITIIRRGEATWTTDADGNAIPGTPVEIQTPGLIQQLEANETLPGPDVRESSHRLFLPATVSVSALDRVRESGRVFDVVGEPDRLDTPSGAHHLEVRLRLVTSS